MSKTNRANRRTNSINQSTYIMYFNRLKELAVNAFKWEGLPPTVDYRFLELVLFELGYCLYFNDEVIGNLALTCTIGGQLDVYRIPIYRRAYATNGYNRQCSKKDSVLIFNNFLHTPSSLVIEEYARRLTEIQRAIDININAQKTPVAILSSEKQRLTMKNLYQQYDGNEPFIFGDKDLDLDGIKVINTQAPAVFQQLQIQKNQVWNEALTYLGIENANADKKERMTVNEVGSNYGNVEAERYTRLMARRQACEQINAMFGTDITVRYNSDLETMLNLPNMGKTIEDVENNDNVSRETIKDNSESAGVDNE